LTSPNAPSTRDVLGTAILAVLSGHQRDAHISALRGDSINAALLDMEAVVSEGSVRRYLGKLDEVDGVAWLQNHLDVCVAPVLGVPGILDADVTVKPLDGHQEGAVKGDNPHKPGRPSHTDHTDFIAGLRLILDGSLPRRADVDGVRCRARQPAEPDPTRLDEDRPMITLAR
jgi:hypothetical protein